MRAKQVVCLRNLLYALALSLPGTGPAAPSGVFTVEVGGASQPPTSLVAHADMWRYRKGTNAPPADWHSVADAALDQSWLTGPGGFGFGDGDDATVFTDMRSNYFTIYLRRSFEVTSGVDSNRHLLLTVDYDDGFIAYLDGVELARSTNAPGAPGSVHPHNMGLPVDHEARGYQGLAVEIFDLGPAGGRLSPGTHVLAVQAINGTIDSSDISLIADLSLSGAAGAGIADGFFALRTTNVVRLSGSNTLTGSTRVMVNGLDANFNAAQGTWSKDHNLAPGLNRLFVAALDAHGAVLAAQTPDVVYETATTAVGGVLASNTTWTSALGTIRVTNTLVVPAGLTLSVAEGVVVLMSPSASIRSTTNGTVLAQGTESNPVYFLPADATNAWRELSARGQNASLTLRRVELVAGQVIGHPSAKVTVEDSLLRDLRGRLFLTATNAQQMALRRCHITRYDQARFSETPVQIEDCLFENIGSDATDFSDHPGVAVRRTTYRFGTGTGTDALDLGNNPGMVIDHCLIHGFPDKGVSIADSSHGVIVRNSLIYSNGFGLSAYASSNCIFVQNTIAACLSGLALYQRAGTAGPGHARGTNNIVWGSVTNVHLADGATLALSYSDVQGGLFPGLGNISNDPLFVGESDYRLSPGSPAMGTGAGGADMGVIFPVGGIPPPPFHLAAHAPGTNEIRIWWQEDADNEAGFILDRSMDGAAWQALAGVGPNVTNFTDTSVSPGQIYFYRVRATNTSGFSHFSNPASAVPQPPITLAGGTLANDTVWSPALGTIHVLSDVIVPANLKLTMQPGTVVKVLSGPTTSNRAGIRAAAGGTIEIAGSWENKVVIMPLNGSELWSELSAGGTGASLIVRQANVSGGQTTVYNGATGLLEDSYFHDYRLLSGSTLFTAPILLSHFAQSLLIRRCHVREYHETLFRNCLTVVEDSLFENIHGDGLDFDAALAGSAVRRCTFRHGTSGNVDAVDVGNDGGRGCTNVVIEDSLMYDFPFDKGVSVGDLDTSRGTVVRNCLIYDCLSGVMAKDNCDVSVRNCTMVDNRWGLTNYNKANPSSPTGGGITTNTFNNILWNNGITIALANGSALFADHNDFGGTNWPGPGNLNIEPRFVNEALRDYRLQMDSPCLGAGRDSQNMGAQFPVGAPMAPSHPSIEAVAVSGEEVRIRFWVDSERSYSLLSSGALSGGAWAKVADVLPTANPRLITVTNDFARPGRFFRLVSPRQP